MARTRRRPSERLSFFPFNAGDWLSDPKCRSKTHEERGVYIDLLALMWKRAEAGRDVRLCSYPNDDGEIARSLGITTRRWRAMRPRFLEGEMAVFATTDDGGAIFSRRLQREFTIALEKSGKASTSARSRVGGKGKTFEREERAVTPAPKSSIGDAKSAETHDQVPANAGQSQERTDANRTSEEAPDAGIRARVYADADADIKRYTQQHRDCGPPNGDATLDENSFDEDVFDLSIRQQQLVVDLQELTREFDKPNLYRSVVSKLGDYAWRLHGDLKLALTGHVEDPARLFSVIARRIGDETGIQVFKPRAAA